MADTTAQEAMIPYPNEVGLMKRFADLTMSALKKTGGKFIHRIWATCAPGNFASAAFLEKIGLIKEGYLRQNIFHNGRWRDSLLFAILRTEWGNSV
jgi:RimJ/RimL family protein N-acetyltransferase